MQTIPDLTTLNDTELAEHLLAVEEDETAVKLAKKKLNNELLNRKAAEIKALYGAKPEAFGIVNLQLGNKIAKIDTSKDVQWDQAQLDAIWKQIAADGANPKDYIKIEYGVSETLYKSWGDNIKAFFSPARTVKAKNPSIKIIDKEE